MLSLPNGSKWSCMLAHCVTVAGVTSALCPVVIGCGVIKLYTQDPAAAAHMGFEAAGLGLALGPDNLCWLQLVICVVCGHLLFHREPFPGRSGCRTEPRDPAEAEAGVWRPTDPAQE